MADKEFVYKITGQHDGKGADEAKSKLDQLTGTLGQSAQASGLVDSKMMSLTAKLGVAAGAMYALKQAVDFASSSLSEFGAQEMFDAKQAAVIKATGEAAGKTSADLKDMASALSESTSLDDAEVQKVQTLLLTFREIKGDIYDSAVKASLDLGAIFGSAESAAMQLGKALQDPVLGVSMLSSAGVTFNQSQKDQIKALVEQNDLLDAQSLILEEVQKKVAGAAEAMGSGYVGTVNRLKNAWGDFKEAIGGTLASLGAIQNVMGGVTLTLRSMESALALPDSTAEFVDRVGVDLKKSAEDAAGAFDKLKESSSKALDEANKKADEQAEKVKRRIAAEKELALAQLDLEKIQKGMADPEYQRKKADIMGVAAHDTYGADREALAAQQEALEKQLAEMEAAAQKAKETSLWFYEHLQKQKPKYEAGLFDATRRIDNIDSLLGNGRKDYRLEQERERLVRKREFFRERLIGVEASLPDAEESALGPAKELETFRQSYAEQKAAIEERQAQLEMQRKTNDAKVEREHIDARNKEADQRRKEAEEREAKMTPGERMGRMLGNVSDTAIIGGLEYANVTGQQVQEQARSAIQKAGADIIAGKDDFQIISQLIAKLQEMGAVFRGGYTLLANELNRLDGDIKDVKSIQKASRQ